mmetsp:Transcript_13198/g.31449  ORF Transcript_13198/g.31449 Transcript_13198/m.31449 type:complete len:269 (+) Transcript_13198:3822-4628(+)
MSFVVLHRQACACSASVEVAILCSPQARGGPGISEHMRICTCTPSRKCWIWERTFRFHASWRHCWILDCFSRRCMRLQAMGVTMVHCVSTCSPSSSRSKSIRKFPRASLTSTSPCAGPRASASKRIAFRTSWPSVQNWALDSFLAAQPNSQRRCGVQASLNRGQRTWNPWRAWEFSAVRGFRCQIPWCCKPQHLLVRKFLLLRTTACMPSRFRFRIQSFRSNPEASGLWTLCMKRAYLLILCQWQLLITKKLCYVWHRPCTCSRYFRR